MMKIAVGSDHAGFILKSTVLEFLKDKAEVLDYGVFSEIRVDYPDIALKVAEAVSRGEADAGVLLCGTGIGVAIAANKIKGIRASACNDVELARMSKAHNDLNVIALGGRVIRPADVAPILDAWLSTSFEGNQHLIRINKIAAAESAAFSTHCACSC